MQNSNVASFMELILFDQALLEYENQLDALYEEMGRLENQKNTDSSVFTRKQEELADIKNYIKTCEEELNESIEEERKINQSHKEVHDKREYAALKKELDHCHVTQESLEKKLLAALAQSEYLEKECHSLVQQKGQEAGAVEGLLTECKAKITALEDTFENAKEKRNDFQCKIPPEWLVEYERMRHNMVDPLAFVMEDSCSRCFQSLTPYEMMQITRGPLKCKGCFRFLCIRPENTGV